MKTFFVLIFTWCVVFAHYNDPFTSHLRRAKRDTVGTLDIVTNHAQAIHADVKGENVNEKPCPSNANLPSDIEPGVVFQVTPPKNAIYESKPSRKFFPIVNVTTDILSQTKVIRRINRGVTLATVLIAIVIEVLPLIQNMFFYISKYYG